MTIQTLLYEIKKTLLTDKAIGARVGIPQATISRLRRGVHKETSHVRTVAIQNLAKETCPDIFGD
jgi:hypothetical protein